LCPIKLLILLQILFELLVVWTKLLWYMMMSFVQFRRNCAEQVVYQLVSFSFKIGSESWIEFITVNVVVAVLSYLEAARGHFPIHDEFLSFPFVNRKQKFEFSQRSVFIKTQFISEQFWPKCDICFLLTQTQFHFNK